MDNTKRLNSICKEAFVIMYAVNQSLEHVERHIEPLARRVPYGWRNYRLAKTMLGKCVDEIIKTIPLDQLLTIRRQMECSEFHVSTKAVGKQDDDQWVVSRDDLAKLVGYAVETTCITCNCENKKRCKLRNIISELPVNIAENSYMPCMSNIEI